MRNPLARKPHELDVDIVESWLSGASVVVITGAGGSIGSEIARQLYQITPNIVLMDRSESALFNVYQDVPCEAVLCDATNRECVLDNLPEGCIVIHAAAYKHVPMIQNNVDEAVRNNFYGTRVVAECAKQRHAKTFILISTDKAVNPVSAMGATKLLAEQYIRQQRSTTDFCIVRFGNVIKSSGSVMEIWDKQRDAGDPITVTDPTMRRYFMSIEEAAAMTLNAGSICKGGETFILDMGPSVCIGELADWYAGTYGCEKEIIGTRPGERLLESLSADNEMVVKSEIEGIGVARTQWIKIDKPLEILH